jgi:hypothetical protein
MATKTGSEEPKNVVVRSFRNMPVIASIIHVEENAKVRAGTNSFPTEDFSFAF